MNNFDNFVNTFNNSINAVNNFNISDKVSNDNETIFRITYTKNTTRNYIVHMSLETGFIKYTLYSDDDTIKRGIFETVTTFNHCDVTDVATTIQYIIICDSNHCLIVYYNTYFMNTLSDEYQNFKNNFCVIIPTDDELPYILEMHIECNKPIYSVSGAHSDYDFISINESLKYFIDLCKFDI